MAYMKGLFRTINQVRQPIHPLLMPPSCIGNALTARRID